ncbi:MAG: glycosyltransferase family 4 protein [Bacteroidia bacterium]|nr:glycosyltransferase family 4 protein [Bacteroidia bacterium]
MKIAILTNIIPTYRKDFYERIFENQEHEITVFCQESIPSSNLKSIHENFIDHVSLVKFYAPFNNDSLVFHFLPFVKLWKDYDLLVVDGNLRHITQALLATIFKLFGKKIVVWSNVYSADGNPILQYIRRSWWLIFDNFLMYTEKDVEILRKQKFHSKNLVAINNGLNQDEIDEIREKWNPSLLLEVKKKYSITTDSIIISSGRVNKVNNHLLALNALKIVQNKIPDIIWVIIGGGTEIEFLKNQAKEKGFEKNIIFLGEIYNEKEKAPWFLLSKILVHPGYMGLTIFNSFGYSLPVITHDNLKNHSPEVYLFEENKTGFLFKENDEKDLAEKIIFALNNKEILENMKNFTYNIAKYKNNTDIMSKQFLKMISSIN